MDSSNKKRKNRLKQSQHQSLKMHQRMYIVVGISSMLLTGGILAFLHFSSTEQSMAQGEEQPQFRMMEDQVFSTDMAIASPVVKSENQPGKNTIFVKKVITDNSNQ